LPGIGAVGWVLLRSRAKIVGGEDEAGSLLVHHNLRCIRVARRHARPHRGVAKP